MAEGDDPDDRNPALAHGWLEDAYALFVGTTLVFFGLELLRAGGLILGGAIGVSLLGSYASGLPAIAILTAINVPLLLLSVRLMGRAFVVKTIIVNLGLILFGTVASNSFQVAYVHEGFAAVVGGSIVGMGALALARHGAGTSGTGALILWLYESRGWNAGISQLVIDGIILAISISIISWDHVAWSLLSTACITGVLFAWHRPGRYAGY